MRQYNSEEEPPAPIVEAEVFHPRLQMSLKGKAKLDTGAGLSVIPEEWIGELRLLPCGEKDVSGYDGRIEKRRTYFVHISFNGNRFEWVEVIASRRENVLIGRDVLNRLKIVLDGKNLVFEIYDPL